MHLTIDFEVGDRLGIPMIKILIDDYVVLYEGHAVDRFDREFDIKSGEHELKIVHFGKTDQDHLYHTDGSIAIDKYVYIKSIEIDQVKLFDSELHTGQFWPVYSLSYVSDIVDEGKELPPCISPNLYLGHNGTWRYTFFYPFIDWIIECRRPLRQSLDSTIFKTSACVLQEAKDFFKDLPDV
jgi:hypothetical protein